MLEAPEDATNIEVRLPGPVLHVGHPTQLRDLLSLSLARILQHTCVLQVLSLRPSPGCRQHPFDIPRSPVAPSFCLNLLSASVNTRVRLPVAPSPCLHMQSLLCLEPWLCFCFF